ncbi:MAG: hypothetical protein F8N38_19000 [Hungatella sp.]|nr:hypothetical protein [Hungatella sp.]
MSRINMILVDGTEMELSAGSIDPPVQFVWGFGIVLNKPVKLNGTELLSRDSKTFGDGTVLQMEDGQTLQGRVELTADEKAVTLRVYSPESNEPMLQATSNKKDNISEINGSVGPFNYMVDIHLDMENPIASQFIVQLSCMGIKLADVHLDAQNPTVKLGATIAGVGVTGLLGVDFDEKRIYVSATVEYIVGKKKYDFDLYHWGNTSVQMVPLLQNTAEGGNGVASAMHALQSDNVGGSITVRNTGGYVAKFKITFTLNGQRIEKESGDFTAGVNKQLDIPAGSTDIQVEAMAAWFIGSWSSIFTVGFNAPVRKSYEVYGTTLNTKWKEIS